MLVYKITVDGSSYLDKNNDSVLSEIKHLQVGSEVTFGLEEMSEEDYDNLPEFDGF